MEKYLKRLIKSTAHMQSSNTMISPNSNKIAFNLNYRWQNSFIWESSFGVGQIPSFQNIDAQVTYDIQKLHSKIKIGGSNILNNYHTTSFGSASIGALYYVTLLLNNII